MPAQTCCCGFAEEWRRVQAATVNPARSCDEDLRVAQAGTQRDSFELMHW